MSYCSSFFWGQRNQTEGCPSDLTLVPDGVTLKPPGSLECHVSCFRCFLPRLSFEGSNYFSQGAPQAHGRYDEHIDFNRLHTLQLLIAVTETEFLLRPTSQPPHPAEIWVWLR